MIKKYYLTSTLPYLGIPHVGHLLEFIQTDVISRYLKFKHGEENVHFNTGLDERGLKIHQAAQKEGIDTQQYCDNFADIWKDFLIKLDIQPDSFYRTTSQDHSVGVGKLWNICLEKGDIYKKSYEAKYCFGCESFKTSKELINGKCPDHSNVDIKDVQEENYFFRLSKYKNHLLDWLQSNQDFLTPVSKRKELENLIMEIEDISVSRLKTSVPWGIPVPNDPEHNVYVWYEALCNYVISCGYFIDENWKDKWDNSIQLCGSDNLRFQAVIWQGILASLDLPHTNKLLVHGTVLDAQGNKMSKTVGNVVDPIEQLSKYGLTSLRYYIIVGLPTYSNCSWNEDDLVKLYNAHLANNFGNLVSRTISLIKRKQIEALYEVEESFKNDVEAKIVEVEGSFDKFELREAVVCLSKIGDFCNEYINKHEPWKSSDETAKVTLSNLYWYLTRVKDYYSIILPNKKNDLDRVILNKEIEILFPRIIV